MKLQEAARQVRTALKNNYDETEAASITALLLEHLTGYAPAARMAPQAVLTPDQRRLLEAAIARLQQNEPIQYLMNKAWFYGLELYVDRGVLIPRPETEELVDWIVKDVRAEGKPVFERKPLHADRTTELKILDVGTGSGCIALALKKAMPLAEVWGCDLSEEALNVARRNGSALDIRVDFQPVDFLNPRQQKQLPAIDILVSNPPYIPHKDKAAMAPNVVQYEPPAALFVPDDDPLVFYKALAVFGRRHLHAHGRLYVEIQEEQGAAVVRLLEEEGYKSLVLKKDMQGKDRMVKGVNSEQQTRNAEG